MTVNASIQLATNRWTCGSTTKTSLRHQAGGRDGQDAAYARLATRPVLLVADGRGSSDHSEIGASGAADCFAEIVDQHGMLVAQCLDLAEPDCDLREERWSSFGQVMKAALVRKQAELAHAHSLESSDLEFTLAAAIVGRKYVGVLQVGDSCVVIERRLEVQLALPPDRGEFANETKFVGHCEGTGSRMASRTFPANDITGLVAFTDGLSHLWLDARTLAVAPGVGRIMRNLGDRLWDQPRLDAFLDRPIWHDCDDDDKGVAYLAMRTSAIGSKMRRRRRIKCGSDGSAPVEEQACK